MTQKEKDRELGTGGYRSLIELQARLDASIEECKELRANIRGKEPLTNDRIPVANSIGMSQGIFEHVGTKSKRNEDSARKSPSKSALIKEALHLAGQSSTLVSSIRGSPMPIGGSPMSRVPSRTKKEVTPRTIQTRALPVQIATTPTHRHEVDLHIENLAKHELQDMVCCMAGEILMNFEGFDPTGHGTVPIVAFEEVLRKVDVPATLINTEKRRLYANGEDKDMDYVRWMCEYCED